MAKFFRRPGPLFEQSAALFLCLIPWFVVEQRKAINWDIEWMTTCAGRLLQGLTMTQASYHADPPLAAIVYIPVYLLSEYAGIPFAAGGFLTTSIYVFLSCAVVFFLMARLLEKDEAFLLSAFAGIAATTAFLADFGERDQLVALGMLPFILGQVILARRTECPRALLAVVFAVGAVLVLLKPHYGLLPVVFLVHRAIAQKRRSIFMDMDFLALAIAAAGYAAIVWFFFNDYPATIMPDVLRLYFWTFNNMTLVARAAAGLAVLYAFVFLCYRLIADADPGRRLVMNVLLASAFVSLVPYIVQMKDFRYHLIPSLTFFWMAAGFLLFIAAQRVVPRRLAACIALLAAAGAGYAANPLYTYTTPSAYTTAKQIEELPLTKLVKSCAPGCSFVVFTVGMPANNLTSYYAGAELASRFPSMWFLPMLIHQKMDMDEGKPTRLTKTDYKNLLRKFAGLVREDIDTKRPTLVITCPEEFDYLGFLSVDPGFAAAWAHYRRQGKVPIDYKAYYPGLPPGSLPPLSCDVYRRKA
jgi:hypothetical protein